jgi:hypothetical protein
MVARKEDGAAAEASFDCIEGRFGLALRRFGAARELSVGLVRGLFGSRDVGEGLGFRHGGGRRAREVMRVHTRLERSTREGENELWELEIGPMSVGRREIGIF